MRISPGTILLQNIPLGDTIDIARDYGHILRIVSSGRKALYTVRPRKPSADRTSATGYSDIQNPDWFFFENDTVVVPAGGIGKDKFYLYIPSDSSLFNRHFLAGVNVSPIVTKDMGSIVLGAYLLFRVETEAVEGIEPIELQRDEIVFVPSVITFDSVMQGESYTRFVEIYYGGPRHLVSSLARLDPNSDVARYTILLTPGYTRVPDSTWFDCESPVVLTADAPCIIGIKLTVPQNVQKKRYEELLLLDGFQKKAFLRIRINIKN